MICSFTFPIRGLCGAALLALLAACAPGQPGPTASGDAADGAPADSGDAAPDGAPLSAIPQLEDVEEAPRTQPGAAPPADDGARIASDALAAVRGEAVDDEATGAADGPGPGFDDAAAGSAAARDDDGPPDDDAMRDDGPPPVDLAEQPVTAPAPETPVTQGGRPDEADPDAPNVVAYALRTSHAVGEQRHDRRGLFTERRFQRNCADFGNQDLAQEEFLRQGGPEEDPLGLDPDGDGYACWWDPEPYRAAARASE